MISKPIKYSRQYRVLVMTLAFLVLVTLCFFCNTRAEAEMALDDSVRLNDMVKSLLMPHISTAVEDFYEPYLTIKPIVATYYGTEIVSIKGGENIHEGIYNSHYTVTIDTVPYVGPHLAVGKDRLTFSFNPAGIQLYKHEHLESSTLPPHYQDIVKQPLP
ncbi:MAG: DUF3888 domain-containing protein [Clostridiales bacterium]|jgi:hypothetical protein|nr:DUF3888 domain-containing protein [Clostridiales bacterium]